MISAPDFEQKICALEAFKTRAGELFRPLVFTNGCFDLLHRGHVTYLAQARALGKSLVVGVNSDESLRRLNKGTNRPINSLAERMAVIAALESVSLVVPFAEETPLGLILLCRPDVLVKGADWTASEIVGAKEVASWGGSVQTIPLTYQTSTTRIIAKIREN
ncbi:MAG: D-glycero-beta-D-manno-heptose 1-phosphate adenylyltransferase [Burkholderiales bacterium]